MNRNRQVASFLALMSLLAGVSCDSKPSQSASSAPATAQNAAQQPTVASLAPAATDLIVGMGASAHLVAVSNYDIDRPNIPRLPRVGDYQNTDWERLADLHPNLIIVQMQADRIPQGFRDRAAGLGAKILDIQIEDIADISKTLDQLGAALNETHKSSDARALLESRLSAVKQRVAQAPPVATYLSLDETGTASAGPGTFLDEILTIAGGKNVLAGTNQHWPSIDKERLIALSPDAVIELLPGASPQVLQQAQSFWSGLPQIPAVAKSQVFPITDPWVLTPGIEVAELAERIADRLHPAKEATK